ncbi:UDP-3-O-(3-hydroxymyristoyl)glucosamine N-acyltransferase [Methylotenera sp. G11]|uniref:UDP-3-O-(3-hydroxymyristoyl)glucosamine N-acyltransferase n=1 Tax=Methylotenera sp. G11 TaxID=1506585 RepID=UPI0006490CB1|nr:UDP-3-O-(3-hydroxymyristoyl)glucosamine N-acyltransferase [Methylotenera sp. G11]
MSKQYSLDEIVSALGGIVVGDGSTLIRRVSSLANAKAGDISFVSDSKYQKAVAASQASAFILKHAHTELTTAAKIITDNPYAYFAKVSAFLNPVTVAPAGIASTAVVAASAQIPGSCSIGALVVIGENVVLGEHVIVGSGCVIENDVAIADHTRLEPNVTIKHHCEIGKNCHIFSGAVIGSDGFGYAEEGGRWIKIPQVGRAILQDNVDVGANTTIDRGALDDTIIEEGVKLDNLIQIGHNCVIGAHSVIAGCVGIAGSARIGRHCKIGGAAMVLGHLEIADNVTISPGSMITRSLATADTYTALMPFQTHRAWLNTAAKIRHLDDFADKIKSLEKEIALLKSQQ